MPERMCDICHKRPATTQVTTIRNGQKSVKYVCQQDLIRL
jgi:protein-arginine kinase activator protein McsA